MMKVTDFTNEIIEGKDEHQDHKYLMAERLCLKLLEKELITEGEFDRIMAKNRESFSPLLAAIVS